MAGGLKPKHLAFTFSRDHPVLVLGYFLGTFIFGIVVLILAVPLIKWHLIGYVLIVWVGGLTGGFIGRTCGSFFTSPVVNQIAHWLIEAIVASGGLFLIWIIVNGTYQAVRFSKFWWLIWVPWAIPSLAFIACLRGLFAPRAGVFTMTVILVVELAIGFVYTSIGLNIAVLFWNSVLLAAVVLNARIQITEQNAV